ncbi:hypothetical protein [Paraburkholderia kirstenboschensis]|uniref:Uncharacterized protein n=1 Tax=Paraburkholderia kirstenboschensis TaxID=1245436 RepID=A0ABZ0EHF5_9BURK|nr:hypothetical protein [Paraburkholderia kirstenboschensis]WOD15950.1 hypothetical protein RW095_22230 [Paraburkholderia kirstenboschensis]
MTYNLNDAIAEAADRAIDPDRIQYPHLFVIRIITNEEIREHQATYSTSANTIEHPYQYLGRLAASIKKVVPIEEARYIPVSGQFKGVSRTKLKVAGWFSVKGFRRSTVTTVEADTWLDTSTGEILTKKSARENGIRIPMAKSISERMLDTIGRIQRCAPGEREFVTYVLKMRNRRGGLVVDLDTVIEFWIAHKYPGIRSTDKSRKRRRLGAVLEDRRVMANSQTLASDLQVLGNPTKQEIIEESARVFEVIKPRPKQGCSAIIFG